MTAASFENSIGVGKADETPTYKSGEDENGAMHRYSEPKPHQGAERDKGTDDAFI